MSVEINEKLLGQVVGQIKNQDDLADLSRQLIKAAVERVMPIVFSNPPDEHGKLDVRTRQNDH